MSITRLKPRKIALAALGLFTLATPVLLSGSAYGHGYTSKPPSRSYECGQATVSDCDQAQWDPDGVEGPKGFPDAGPADGQICAGGVDRFYALDQPRDGKWPATKMVSGGPVDFTWHLTAIHATTDFSYYITKPGWDPTKPLRRADLDLKPFLKKDYGGEEPPGDFTDSGTLPSGQTGRALILAVWTIADTGNAFYQCIDADFGK